MGQAETGNYYYGARYYDSKISVWLSVDPMATERSWLTPYNFVQNNPLMRVDPNGMLDIWPPDENLSELNPTTTDYPDFNQLRETLGPDAQDKVYSFTSMPDFVETFNITYDQEGQEKLSALFLGIELTESHSEERRAYSTVVAEVTTQLYDESLISPENPDGFVDGTWLQISLPTDQIPQNTSFTLNPGLDPNVLPKVELGEGLGIYFLIKPVIYEPF